MSKTANWLQKGALALFLLAYGFSLVCIGIAKEHPPLIYFSACGLGLVALFFLHRFLRRQGEGKLRRIYPFLLLGLLILMPVIQSLLGMALEFEPHSDLGRVYQGAIDWAEQGSYGVDEETQGYFAFFPNNLGVTSLLAGLFWLVGRLGSDQYYLAGVILTSMLVTASIVVCVDLLRRIAGYAAAFVGAAVFLILPPYYVAGAVFYSDTISYVFPPLLLWLHLVARGKPLHRRLPLDLLWALCAFVGFQIKATPLIMVVAIWIVDLLRWRLKPLLPQVIATACVFVLGTAGWNAWVIERHMDDAVIADNAMPHVGWLVAGAGGDTRPVFSAGETHEERNAAGWVILGDLLKEKWADGTALDFYVQKTATNLGTGAHGLAEFLDDNPWNETWLHEWLLYYGPYYGLYYAEYDAYCSGMMLALVLLALYAAAVGLLRKKSLAARYPQPFVALLGIFLFLLAWETRERYFSNFFSILIVAAIMGLCQLSERCPHRKKKKPA